MNNAQAADIARSLNTKDLVRAGVVDADSENPTVLATIQTPVFRIRTFDEWNEFEEVLRLLKQLPAVS